MEIKNLNSLNNIGLAVELESAIQQQKILTNQIIEQQTKRFDESHNQLVVMRQKTDGIDYRYFPEPNLPVVQLDPEFIKSIEINELPQAIRKRYLADGISSEYVEQIINQPSYLHFLDALKFANKAEAVKIFFAEIVALSKKTNQNLEQLNIKPAAFDDLLNLLDQGIISGKQLKMVVPKLVNLTTSVEQLIETMNIKLISDEATISA